MKKLIYFFSFLTLAATSFSSMAQMSSMPPLSADVSFFGNGQSTLQGKYYWNGQALRMEMGSEKASQTQILRMDRNIAWMVMKEMGVYMEMPLPFNPLLPKKTNADMKEDCVGDETINGISTQKCHIQATVSGKVSKAIIWKAPQMGNMVVKTTDETGKSGMVLSNIQKGAQPDALFAEPAGLKKIQVQGGVEAMKSLMGN